MNTNTCGRATPAGNLSRTRTWFDTFKRQGYYLKPVIIGTLLMGMYAHLTALFIGHDLLRMYVLTPAYDMALAVPMTYAGIVSWIVRRRVIHASSSHRLVYTFLAVYFAISIPIHIRTYIAGNTDYVELFPLWYSALILPMMSALLVFAWRLRFKAPMGEQA
jgi:hypothetical protein